MEYPGVACDWITGRHEYAAPVPVRESGRIMKIDRDGVIEYETQTWESIKCSSSETSIRVKCDGRTLRFMGNIGRFGEQDNELGLTVMQCMDKWAEVLRKLGFDLSGFGTRGVRKVNTEAGYGEAAGVRTPPTAPPARLILFRLRRAHGKAPCPAVFGDPFPSPDAPRTAARSVRSNGPSTRARSRRKLATSARMRCG